MMASPAADDVSTTLAPLSANPSRNPRCLRARAPVIASTYTYGMAKAGLGSLVRSLSVEVAPDRINVDAVAPGLIATP